MASAQSSTEMVSAHRPFANQDARFITAAFPSQALTHRSQRPLEYRSYGSAEDLTETKYGLLTVYVHLSKPTVAKMDC